ncbi:MAG: hypothetical protein A2234_05080 [Elusimicrobia bacterium RIFOXYA2_FULL_58_8]|nr:MAG: hypothetical protein A2234_05080 [Elusimicrobia bacterium RIFOXYA2_FULL_58_8]OGS13443.1 MAG: hypothetical protein A2285_07300 [Elusimicrobia bacterium RIFOXYA12_FULL_57_11]
MTERTPVELLKETIAKLEELSADVETEDAVALEANKQITVLRTKLQEAALDSMVSRTPALEKLSLAITTITNSAVHAGIGDKVASLAAIMDEVHGLLDLAKRGPKTL